MSEPAKLAAIRRSEVARLEAVLASGRHPVSADFGKLYAGPGSPPSFKETMWAAQHYKCGWCERRDLVRNRDVEHFRPKAMAVGRDGVERPGWWWLAWTWENLFFACDGCNRYEKRAQFPLADESRRLTATQVPPGPERPLLIDPAGPMDPMDHLIFRPMKDEGDWWVFPRNGSVYGSWTIRVLDLNRDELRTLYQQRYEVDLRAGIDELKRDMQAARAAGGAALDDFRDRWRRYILSKHAPTMNLAGLTHDIHDHHFPPRLRQHLGLAWRRP